MPGRNAAAAVKVLVSALDGRFADDNDEVLDEDEEDEEDEEVLDEDEEDDDDPPFVADSMPLMLQVC